MTFGDTTDERESARILDYALSEDITWVDTANAYAGGKTEEILGRLLHGQDDVVLATKAGMPNVDVAGDRGLLAPKALRIALEGSLRRLRRERVDMLYLHCPDRDTPLQDTLQTVADLVREGKIRALGISNYSAWQVSDLIRAAAEVDAPQPLVSQQMYNMLARRLDEEYTEFAATVGVPTMVYNPLAGGLLTGRFDFATPAESGRFSTARIAQTYRDRYWDVRLFEAVQRLEAIAAKAEMPLLELALRWTATRPVTNSLLLGASRLEQLRSNLDALRHGPLESADMAAIDAVGADLRGPMPAYNR
jgi:aryl-alcohol dehydrogenase-like predicted oxidoreductase